MIDIPTSISSEEINTEELDNKIERKVVKDKLGRSYATGKRKNAIARVWIKAGSGKVTVNGKPLDEYFARPILRIIVNQPFAITGNDNKFDISCTVIGGGLSGQAGAIKHGVSKALGLFDPDNCYVTLRKNGFLTRDSRVVERKKYGRRKARRSFQFSKR